jgi:hypothetical protein
MRRTLSAFYGADLKKSALTRGTTVSRQGLVVGCESTLSRRRFAPVPLALTSPAYQQLRARLNEGLRKAGMPE